MPRAPRFRQAWRLLLGGVLAVGVGVVPADAGHEMPFYPSYYPQEITVEAMTPAAAAARLGKHEIHAYVGADPFAGKPLPAAVKTMESLGSWVVVTLNPTSPALGTPEARCALAGRVLAGLSRETEGWTFHPYPVTPWHADYLHHADLAAAARKTAVDGMAGKTAGGIITARGPLAQRLAHAPARADAWHARVEEVPVAEILAAHGHAMNGWQGPPWLKEGWFHAWALLATAQRDRGARQRAQEAFARLTERGAERPEARVQAERDLVTALRSGCERVIAGFTVAREPLNDEYSAGVENVAAGALAGLNHPIFLRTVKLKDFPWNGWLTLGVKDRPTAAWNPVAGFTDPAGRLVWSALADPALFPEPSSSGWTANRVLVDRVETPPDPIAVPREALRPEPGTGRLREVGEGRTARARVTYQVLTSAFHDGTPMSVADVLYGLAFAFAWGGAAGPDGDPHVARATALGRETLVGVRVLRVETKTLRFGDIQMQYQVPIVEAYLDRADLPAHQLATLVPPWSAVPWHLLVLMEEAVRRGVGAFSETAARQRSVPWLDLVRDARTRDRLAEILKGLEAESRVPPALAGRVDAREARRRWGALARFAAERRHFLVTSGPYAVHAWSPAGAVLRVVRDFSYPLGVGSYDRYPLPLRVFVNRVETRADRLELHADVERIERFAREYRIVTEALAARLAQKDAVQPVCRYVVLDAGGAVVRTGTAPATAPGVFAVPLDGLARPLTALVAPAVGGNLTHAHVEAIRVE